MDTALPTDMVYVIDGGCLLHRLAWTRGHTVEQITQLHVQFVQRSFGRTVQIIFDGYSCGASMKDHEHRRRSGKVHLQRTMNTDAAVVKCIYEGPRTQAPQW